MFSFAGLFLLGQDIDPRAQDIESLSRLLESGAALEKVAGGFEFTEGPAVDGAGNVFFTDQPNDRILKWSVDGELSVFLQPSGRSNGLFFDRQGNLLACADLKNELWSIDPKGKITVLARDFEGKLLNGPNDVWAHRGGWIYFTDPFYKRSYWERGPAEQDVEGVYLLFRSSGRLVRVVDDLVKPNGIIGTPDGKTLFVADIRGEKTYRYRIRSNGLLTNKKLFCEQGSDGMTLDSEGNLYLTGNGVTVFDPAGRRLGQIEVPERWTANVCFGGRDLRTLFITASQGLYAIRMRTSGVR